MSEDIRLDLARRRRIGMPEAILCEGKSDDQLQKIAARLELAGEPALFTRLSPDAHLHLKGVIAGFFDYDPLSRTGFLNGRLPDRGGPKVGIVAAGSSDLPAAAEAERTLAFHGISSQMVADVGVAGLWRLTEQLSLIEACPIVITAAGMEGALPSVLGGLVPSAIIAIPTSTGYGAARAGETALMAALTSCAQGITVVNIGNGFGAACAAIRILNTCCNNQD